MNIELKSRKAIVTGSTAGIGRAIAEGLARAGASVVARLTAAPKKGLPPRSRRCVRFYQRPTWSALPLTLRRRKARLP
jgi:NAD(P)-dependent dehydrogenase (short-subunit alcohol dehydrogenase family)